MKTKHDLTAFDIAALIRARLRGELSSEDEQRLQAWMDEAPANRRLLEQLTDGDWRNREVEQMLQYTPEGKWQQIIRKAQHRKRMQLAWRYAAVAAVAVVFVGISVFLRPNRTEESIPVLTAESSAIARLTTGSGKVIVLDSTLSRTASNITLRNGNEIVIAPDSTTNNTSAEVKYNTLEIMRGGEYRLLLADGSVVFLNSQTTLKFPDNFSGCQDRRVYLTGEALFKVAKDTEKPFIVECNQYEVKVLGTIFNISSYDDDAFSHTTLKEGKVEINREGERVVLEPGLQAWLENGKMTVKSVDVDNYTTWMEDHFRFKSENIDMILKRLSRWYDFEVFYRNPDVKNYHFSGYLPRYGKVSDVLELLSKTTDIRFEVNHRTVIVSKNK